MEVIQEEEEVGDLEEVIGPVGQGLDHTAGQGHEVDIDRAIVNQGHRVLSQKETQ